MIVDIYCYRGTDSEKFMEEPKDGGVIWLDGTKGFAAGSFSNKETDELLRIILIPQTGQFPNDADAFENLPLIEAQILEPGEEKAKVKVLSVQKLGDWAGRVRLGSSDALVKVPSDVRPTEEKFEEVNDVLRAKGRSLWTSTDTEWQEKNKVNAIYFFKSEFDKRGLILTTNGAPSYLVVAGG